MFINDRCVGVNRINHKHGEILVPCFKVPYEEGKIKAVAYDEKGNILCEDIKKSFKDAFKICLKSDKNIIIADSINILFEDKNGNRIKQLIEFTHNENYEEKIFRLKRIKGIQKLTFVFLPGCNFDFGYFRFIK